MPGAYAAGSAGKIVGDKIAASVTGSVGSVTAAVTTSAADQQSSADVLLGRNLAGGSSGGRTVRDALRFLRNKWAVVTGTLTVYQEDDTTPAWTGAVSSDVAAIPIVGNDPA